MADEANPAGGPGTDPVISGPEYLVRYSKGTQTVTFEGTLRLNSYDEIKTMVRDALTALGQAGVLTLDVRQVKLLNSSGINLFAGTALSARTGGVKLRLLTSPEYSWQAKMLGTLRKLMPTIEGA
jgi:anti-anti-sigma factor